MTSRDLDREVVRTLLADPDSPFDRPDAVILKASRTTTVAELTMPVGGVPTCVIYKRFNRKKWLDPILTLFRPSRGWQAWQAGQHLASRAVPTPMNLAFLARTGPFQLTILPRETYLVTVKADPSMTLADYVNQVLPALDPDVRGRRTRRLARGLARLIRTLHERSLSHRDLKAANILIEGDPASDDHALLLIDLGGVRLKHPLPTSRRLQNLARLHVSLAECSRTDALRFLRAYLPSGDLANRDWKAIWRAIVGLGRRKHEQNLRRGRPLS